MYLEEDFDALEGSCDEGHWDCGEETGGGDLGDGKLVVFDGGEAPDEAFADVVAPEGDGDCWVVSSVGIVSGGENLHIGVTPRRGAETPAYRP